MGTQAEIFGGSDEQTFGSNIKVHHKRAWVHVLTASTSGLEVSLPDATRISPGYPIIQIVNAGATNDFDIVDADGGAVTTLTITTDNVATFALIDNSTTAGEWKFGKWTLNSTGAPAATIFPWTLGGSDSGGGRTPFKFDFTANTWSASSNLSTLASTTAGGARIEGDGYITNGFAKDHEAFDADTAWSVKTDQQYNRDTCQGAEQATTEDRAYYIGTNTSGSGDLSDYYDKSGDSFTDVSDLPEQKHYNFVTSDLAGYLYTGCGSSSYASTQNANDTVYRYDVSGDSFASRTAAGVAALLFAYAIADSATKNVVKYGGRNKTSSSPTNFDDVERYNLSSDTWTTRSDFTGGTTHSGAATHIDENERSYIVCGTYSGGDGDSVFYHTDLSDTYTSQQDHSNSSNNGRFHVMLPLTT